MVRREMFEQMLSGEKLTEEDKKLRCSSCNKPLHEGEDVTVSVRYVADIAYPGGVNCGACDIKGLDGDVARGILVSIKDATQQTHSLALSEPRIEKRD